MEREELCWDVGRSDCAVSQVRGKFSTPQLPTPRNLLETSPDTRGWLAALPQCGSTAVLADFTIAALQCICCCYCCLCHPVRERASQRERERGREGGG